MASPSQHRNPYVAPVDPLPDDDALELMARHFPSLSAKPLQINHNGGGNKAKAITVIRSEISQDVNPSVLTDMRSLTYDDQLSIIQLVGLLLPQAKDVVEADYLTRYDKLSDNEKFMFSHRLKSILCRFTGKDFVNTAPPLPSVFIELMIFPQDCVYRDGLIGFIPIGFDSCNSMEKWAVIFGEVRPVSGTLVLRPLYSLSSDKTRAVTVGALDFTSTSALVSAHDLSRRDDFFMFDAAPSHDSSYSLPLEFKHADYVDTENRRPWLHFNYALKTCASFKPGTSVFTVYGRVLLEFRKPRPN